ncbi:MAG: cell filamentation protein Fic, partial [Sphingobacteriales bacterium]
GLHMGNDSTIMCQKFGEVMGLFAYGHPFLDGNGRTMLLVHIELCHRAGFSIAWQKTNKIDYLTALSQEIDTPSQGILDAYLLQFKHPQKVDRAAWEVNISTIQGLDGFDDNNQIDGDLSDPMIAEKYKKFEEQRGYTYTDAASSTLKSKPKIRE